jgi:hypothetical protein
MDGWSSPYNPSFSAETVFFSYNKLINRTQPNETDADAACRLLPKGSVHPLS